MSRALSLLAAITLSLPAFAADGIAVLAVDTSGQGDAAGDPLPAAQAIRGELAKKGARVVSSEDTRRRLRGIGLDTTFELAAYEARLQAAEDTYAALDTERSLEILGAALRDLATDVDFSTEKRQLLERSRVRAAGRLMALAGAAEQGEADTPLGKRALSHLVAAVRSNPALELSEQEHPPKMRRLLDRAQAALKEQGLGGLSVDTTPAGATVYVEGRPVGVTPLQLKDALPHGQHRVWVTLDATRSLTRWVEVGEQPAHLEVDLSFEGTLWASGPGVRPIAGQTITEAVAAKATELLDVEQLVLVGFASYDDGRWLYGALYERDDGSGRARQAVRRGAVRLSQREPSAEDIAQLGGFLSSGDGRAIDATAVPSTVLPGEERTTTAPAAQGEEGEEGDVGGSPLLWAGIGAGAGAVVLGALGAGAVTYLLLANGASGPTGRFELEVVQ